MSADLIGDLFAPRLLRWNPKDWPVQADWQPVLDAFWQSHEGQQLAEFVVSRLAAGAVVYPTHPLWALQLTPLSGVKVVILGQDPYHGPNQAQGLSFSVPLGVKIPPSLRNIFKELQRDLGHPSPLHGSLVGWAKQGVLLLNTSLTVEDGLPASHAKRGWETLTDALIAEVARTSPACVFMLWGAHAQAKSVLIASEVNKTSHATNSLVLKANHPSPLSATRAPQPFIGCAHFSTAKNWLADRGHFLDWALVDAQALDGDGYAGKP